MALYLGLDLGQRHDYTALFVVRHTQGERDVPITAARLWDERQDAWVLRRAQEEIPLPVYSETLEAERADRRRLLAVDEAREQHSALAQMARTAPTTIVEQRRVTVTRYEGIHLERFRHVPYTDVVRRVASLTRRPELHDAAALVIDATGVGVAVLDLFRECPDLGVPIVAVTITGGDTVRSELDGGIEHHWVPKRDLVSVLQVLMPDPEDEDDPASVRPDAPRLLMAAGLPLTTHFLSEAHLFKAKITLRGHDAFEAAGTDEWREQAHDDIVLAVALPLWYVEHATHVGAPGLPPEFLGGQSWRRTHGQPGQGSRASHRSARR